MARAVYRGYGRPGRKAGQVTRLHVIREEGPKGAMPGSMTLCGAGPAVQGGDSRMPRVSQGA